MSKINGGLLIRENKDKTILHDFIENESLCLSEPQSNHPAFKQKQW
jgi:hypothetical protein